MKKIILAIIAILIFTSSAAFANEALYTQEIQNDLNTLGIMTGDENGNLNLSDNITRAEATKLICVAGNLYIKDNNDAVIFPDVPLEHWAHKYISAAYEAGIVKGDENGLFNPENNVTNEEFIKMTICLLGYEPMAEVRGGYPAGYNTAASTYGLTKGFSFEVNVPALRRDMAVIIWRALDTPVMLKKLEKEGSVSYIIMNGQRGIPLTTLRNGTTKWDTSKENINNYLSEFASKYPYKEGDTEKSFELYPDIVYTSGIDKYLDGTEYEAPAMYFDEMAQNLISKMETGICDIEFKGESFKSDFITFNLKYLVPVNTISKLGLDASVNPAMYLATIKNDTTTLEIQPNVIGMRKNQALGYWVPLDVCARIFKDTFYVPLEAVISEFGYTCEITENKILIK